MLKLDQIVFDFTDLGGPRATGYDIIAKYMRQFFADDPRIQADVMEALDLCIHIAIQHDNAARNPFRHSFQLRTFCNFKQTALHSPEASGLTPQKSPRLSPRAPTNLSRPLSRCSSRPGSTPPLYHTRPQILPKSCQKSPPILTHSNQFQSIPTIHQNPPNPCNSRPRPHFPALHPPHPSTPA